MNTQRIQMVGVVFSTKGGRAMRRRVGADRQEVEGMETRSCGGLSVECTTAEVEAFLACNDDVPDFGSFELTPAQWAPFAEWLRVEAGLRVERFDTEAAP